MERTDEHATDELFGSLRREVGRELQDEDRIEAGCFEQGEPLAE